MERETGLEPATSSLGSWHSTTELLPLSRQLKSNISRDFQATHECASLRILDSTARHCHIDSKDSSAMTLAASVEKETPRNYQACAVHRLVGSGAGFTTKPCPVGDQAKQLRPRTTQ